MNFYEFSKDLFDNYALILANTIDEAISFYNENVSIIKNDLKPKQLDHITGFLKFLKPCKTINDYRVAEAEMIFVKELNKTYLLLVDENIF